MRGGGGRGGGVEGQEGVFGNVCAPCIGNSLSFIIQMICIMLG